MDDGQANRVRELIDRAEAMEHSAVQVQVAEDAVRLADLHGDVDLGFEARQVVISAAVFSGQDERAIAPFTWCLAQSDRDPGRFPGWSLAGRHSLIWKYKWIIGAAEDWPQISLDRLYAMMDDMERRHREHGFSDRSTLKHRLSTAILRGDEQEVRAMFRKWRVSSRDALSDCIACDCNQEIIYWAFLGEDERAWETAHPIMSGVLSCATVPRISYAQLLLPLVRLGRLTEAVQCHLKGFRLSVRNPKWTKEGAQHMLFLALTGHHTKALRLLESHIPFPHDPIATDRADYFEFFLSARFLMERLTEERKKTIRLRLPESFPAHQSEGKYVIRELEDWFASEAARIAARFDERNKSDAFARRIEANLNLADLVSPYPLRAPRSGRPSSPSDSEDA
jgi:hypothetical protein